MDPRTGQSNRSAPPRKVLFVNHEVELGGAERSLLELLAHLDRDRFTPVLACSHEGPLASGARALGIELRMVQMRHRSKLAKALGLLRASRILHQCILADRIALVHTNSLIAGYCGVRAARRAGVPCVWHVRDMGYPWLAMAAANRADWRIANSAATAADLGGDCTTVIHNGVRRAFFVDPEDRAMLRAAVRDELGLPMHQRLVTMVGRLDRWKGHTVLLDAAARLRSRVAQTTFLVVGDELFSGTASGYRAELERSAANLGIGKIVRFLGQREDVPRLLAASDALVHPSIEPEPFGRSIAEAQAAAIPVIASDIGGIPELIEDGVNGYLIPPGDADALADHLEKVLDDPEVWSLLAMRARQRAEHSWTAEAHARAVEQVYARVLQLGDSGLPTATARPAVQPARPL